MADLPSVLIKHPITYDRPVQLTPLVRRLTANNPSPYTGEGTNTYLVGNNGVSVIDPGPADRVHIDGILEACNGKIERIIATHNHMDHSPAAKVLADETGAPMLGLIPDEAYEYTDLTFSPAKDLFDGELIQGSDHHLRVVHTPGHLKQHLCLLLGEESMLLAGDHVMQGATVTMIQNHGGSLKDYLMSIRKLQQLEIKTIAPAHGHLMGEPSEVLARIYQHRIERENQIVEVLQENSGLTSLELVGLVYPGLPDGLTKAAQGSLESHLHKLQQEGRADVQYREHWLEDEHRWSLL